MPLGSRSPTLTPSARCARCSATPAAPLCTCPATGWSATHLEAPGCATCASWVWSGHPPARCALVSDPGRSSSSAGEQPKMVVCLLCLHEERFGAISQLSSPPSRLLARTAPPHPHPHPSIQPHPIPHSSPHAAVMGGVMKPTACGRWCHSACGLWTEETRLDAERGVITGVQEVRVGVSAEGRGGAGRRCVLLKACIMLAQGAADLRQRGPGARAAVVGGCTGRRGDTRSLPAGFGFCLRDVHCLAGPAACCATLTTMLLYKSSPPHTPPHHTPPHPARLPRRCAARGCG